MKIGDKGFITDFKDIYCKYKAEILDIKGNEVLLFYDFINECVAFWVSVDMIYVIEGGQGSVK